MCPLTLRTNHLSIYVCDTPLTHTTHSIWYTIDWKEHRNNVMMYVWCVRTMHLSSPSTIHITFIFYLWNKRNEWMNERFSFIILILLFLILISILSNLLILHILYDIATVRLHTMTVMWSTTINVSWDFFVCRHGEGRIWCC